MLFSTSLYIDLHTDSLHRDDEGSQLFKSNTPLKHSNVSREYLYSYTSLYSYTKNRHTPHTLMKAPSTSSAVTFCLNSKREGSRMKIGVRAMMVWAIPVLV